MPLDSNTLQTAVFTAFKNAKSTPPPSDSSQTDKVQVQILTQLAQDLTSAIKSFVQSGDVVQVTVSVTDPNTKVVSTGTQTGVGKIQ